MGRFYLHCRSLIAYFILPTTPMLPYLEKPLTSMKKSRIKLFLNEKSGNTTTLVVLRK